MSVRQEHLLIMEHGQHTPTKCQVLHSPSCAPCRSSRCFWRHNSPFFSTTIAIASPMEQPASHLRIQMPGCILGFESPKRKWILNLPFPLPLPRCPASIDTAPPKFNLFESALRSSFGQGPSSRNTAPPKFNLFESALCSSFGQGTSSRNTAPPKLNLFES
uniref:Uncharacterized protein n=1 Tax=Arundo donax TaxID=35708 RepID=A0A0A9FIE2_ARUDO